MSREVLFININNEFRAFVVFSCFLVQIQEDVQELYVFLLNKMMDSSLEYQKNRCRLTRPGEMYCCAKHVRGSGHCRGTCQAGYSVGVWCGDLRASVGFRGSGESQILGHQILQTLRKIQCNAIQHSATHAVSPPSLPLCLRCTLYVVRCTF